MKSFPNSNHFGITSTLDKKAWVFLPYTPIDTQFQPSILSAGFAPIFGTNLARNKKGSMNCFINP
jgi:hypothetical protein